KLKQEIEYLSSDKRREVAERIRHAREFGDIAENSEYDDAKNEQAMLEHRIATLEERMRSARVISKKDIAKDVVSVGSTVRLRDVDANKTFEYRIVGSAEANPSENKLSNESPVGRGIIGVGEAEVAGQIPFTPRAKKVLELALREAMNLGHNYIGTEHILLGIARENDGVASRIMLDFGADAETIRGTVIAAVPGRPRP